MPVPYFRDTWEECAKKKKKKSPFSSKLELGVFSLLKVTLGKTLSTPEARAGCFRLSAARLFPASTILSAILSPHRRFQMIPFNCTIYNDNKDRLWKLHVCTRS